MGYASLNSAGPFDSGFTLGFDRGNSLSALGTIEKMHFVADFNMTAFAALPSARATLEAKTKFEIPHLALFQVEATLTGNSVLLSRGSASIAGNSTFQGRLLSKFENPDIVNFILYLNRTQNITSYIDKNISIDSYLDKQQVLDLYIDKQSSSDRYIDKQVGRELIRER